MQSYIYKAVTRLTKTLSQTSEIECRPFDQARTLVLHTMFIAMAMQRHLVPDEMELHLNEALQGDIVSLLNHWDVGRTLCDSTMAPLAGNIMSVLRSVMICAQSKVWPSHWLGSLLENVDTYAKFHGEDEARARHSRRHNGVYYTNPRLVKLVVQEALRPLLQKRTTVAEVLSLKVIDPAVGGANFLVEMVQQLAQALYARGGGDISSCRREILKHCIYGIDVDPLAATIARCTLWLEIDGGEPEELIQHIVVGDSLLGTYSLDVEQFDLVVGNPPWNKIKADLKEFYGHYDPMVFGMQGSSLKQYVETEFVHKPELQFRWQEHRQQVQSYLHLLLSSTTYIHQSTHVKGRLVGSDPDFYKFFLERSLQMARPGGRVALLLPAALCTAKGAVELRRMLLAETRIEILVTLENKDKSFPIDTRFKYLMLITEKGCGPTTVLPSRFMLNSIDQAEKHLATNDLLLIPVDTLTNASPDNVTFTDVKVQRDVLLLEKLHSQFPSLGTYLPDTWNVRFVRELDMTNDSHLFWSRDELEQQGYWREPCGCYKNFLGQKMIPLVEGRMVHQFDYASKAHIHGHGRKAIWKELPWTHKQVITHYYVAQDTATRVPGYGIPRAGYCDVTGQTNERTVLAALLLGGCIAGNKVPTLRIESNMADPLEASLLWLAIANSFVVDWLMRMRMSITINYFHWHEIPFPRMHLTDPRARELITASAQLSMIPTENTLDTLLQGWLPTGEVPLGMNYEVWYRQYIRAELDARVAALYDLSVYDYAYILTTFPLLDRNQPALSGDQDMRGKPHSYITRDLALLTYFRHLRMRPPDDLVAFFYEIGVNVDSQIGELRNLEERVERAHALGAVAYVPTGSKFP